MNRFEAALRELDASRRLRSIPEENDGLIDLVSNDYLSLAAREEEFHGEFLERYKDASFSSSASRLLSRRQKYHNMLELYLEEAYRKSVLLFNSGYQANVGTLSALASKETLFISDSLMHASAIDGMMLGKGFGKSTVEKFSHNDIQEVRSILERRSRDFETVVVVTESIFSMDGDLGRIRELTELRREFPNLLLYVDEAHALGVRGERGLGMAEELGLIDEIDIMIGTMGKAVASSGAFVATSREIRDYLINRARSFIFSTAMPPINAAWSLFMLQRISGMTEEREKLKKVSDEFRNLLAEVNMGAGDGKFYLSESQIVPFVCGNAEKAIKAAENLRRNGFDVLPIRYPTVAIGTERLRFSLNSSLTIEDLSPIPEILNQTHLTFRI